MSSAQQPASPPLASTTSTHAPLLPNPPSPNTTLPTAANLVRLAHNSLHILNTRDFSHQTPLGLELLTHISSSYTATLDNIPHPLTWLELNDVWRSWYAADSRLAFNMRDCKAYVDEEAGTARVYMDMEVMGLGGVEVMRGFTELRWRVEGGRWMIWGFEGMRVMPGNDGFI